MVNFRILRTALLFCTIALPSVVAGQGRSVYDASVRALAGRRELTALADSLARAMTQPGVSDARRRAMQEDLDIQRQRLAIGDISPGDRILVRMALDGMRQDTSGTRQDTLVISSESTIDVAGVPPISLRGLLHSEVERHVQSQITAVIRNARVSAVPLMSIGVLGSVTRPGYFFVPVTASVTEAIMAAGGPSVEADPNGLVLQRGGRPQWDSATMTAAIQQRVSLAGLGADDGDVLLMKKAPGSLDRSFLLGALGFVLQGVFIVGSLR